MNKLCYRLKFSHVFNMFVAVPENAVGRGKVGQGVVGRIRSAMPAPAQLRLRPLCALLAASSLLSGMTFAAGLVADPKGGAQVAQTANGVPLVNITAPDARGLSRNTFTQLNMSNPGMVLNNSTQDGVTKIGGAAMKNPQLTNQAKGILLESTGTSRSQLSGALEVFGGKADVLIANPNGISVNGMSTINTNNLVLSTGAVTPQLDGSVRFNVQKNSGSIDIGPGGMNVDGLTKLDLVARGITVNGPIAGTSSALPDIQLIAGQNSYNPETGLYKVLTEGGGAGAPQYAISVESAMYGNSVHLISTEKGVGVKSDGLIKTAQDLIINSKGDLILALADAKGAIQMVGTGNAVLGDGSESGGVISRSGALTGSFSGDVTVNNDVVASDIAFQADNLTMNHALLRNMESSVGSTIDVHVTKKLTLNGDISTIDRFSNQAVDGVVARYDQKSGQVAAFDAKGAEVKNTFFVSDAGLRSGGQLNVHAGSIESVKGELSASGTVKLAVSDAFNNAGVVNGAEVTMQAGQLKNDFAITSAKTALNIDAAALVNNAQMSASDALNIALGEGPSSNAGTLSGRSVNFSRRKDAVGPVTFENAKPGTVESLGGDMTIALDGVTNKGVIVSTGDLKVTASNTVDNSGALLASNNLSMTVANLSNHDSGVISAQDVVVTASQHIDNTGNAVNPGDTMIAGDRVTLNTASLANNAYGHLNATDKLAVTTENYANTGDISSAGDATLTMANGKDIDFTAQAMAPTANHLLTVNAHNVTIDADTQNPGSIVVNATGDVTNNQSLVSAQDLTINAAGTVTNTKKSLLWAGNDVSISSANIVNERGAAIEANRDIHLTADVVTNDVGHVTADRDLYIDATTLNNNSVRTDTGPGYKTTGTEDVNTTAYTSGFGWGKASRVQISGLQKLSSTLNLEQGVLQGNRNVYLNQGSKKDTGATINNNGGQIIAGTGDLKMNGNVNNTVPTVTLSLMDQLSLPASGNLWAMQLDAFDDWVLSGGDAYQANFGNLKNMLNYLFSGDSSINYWGAYDISKDQLKNTLAQAANSSPVLQGLLNAALGADWKGQSWGTLVGRWDDTKKNPSPSANQQFLPGQQALLSAGGTVQQDGGSLHNGDGAVQHENQQRTATIGQYNPSTVSGNFNASINFSNPDLSMDPAALLSDKHKFKINPNWTDGNGRPFLSDKVNGAAVTGPVVFPLYETNPIFTGGKESMYGTEYFLKAMGYTANQQVRVIGDTYLVNQMIQKEAQASTNGYLAQAEKTSGDDLVGKLMDNAGIEVKALKLVLGVEPTAEQLAAQTIPFVWYVMATVEGQQVLEPRVYIPQSMIAAQKAQLASGSAAIVGGTVSIAANEGGVSNVNALIKGTDGATITSRGDVVNVADGGLNGGIVADKGAIVVKALGKIANDGASVDGNGVLIAGKGGVSATVSAGYDANGKVMVQGGSISGGLSDAVKEAANATSGAADPVADKAYWDNFLSKKETVAAGTVDIKSQNGVTLTAATVKGANISIDGGEGKVVTNTVNIADSSFDSTHVANSLYTASTSDTKSSTTAIGANIDAGKGNLTIKGNGITLNGGSYSGASGSMDAQNGDLVIAAAQNYSNEVKTARSIGFVAGAEIGAGDAKASANYSTVPGQSSSSATADITKSANYGNQNAGGSLGSAHTGFEMNTSTDTDNAKKNTNAELKFTDALSLKSTKTVDIGGGNIAVDSKSGSIDIDAGKIASTKYVDEDKQTHESTSLFIGATVEQHSSIKKVADDIADQKQKADNGQTKDAGTAALQAGTYAGDATNVVFGDTYGATNTYGINSSTTKSSSSSKAENITHLSGANISMTSHTGDIDLNGVQSASTNLALNSAGNVNVRAAKAESESSSETSQWSVGATGNLSTNAVFRAAGAGVTAGFSVGGSKENTADVNYTNSELNATNVTVRSAKDLNLAGANVKGDQVDLNVGGNTNVTSVQDKHESSSSSWSFNASGGVAVGVNNTLDPVFQVVATPMGALGYSGSESKETSTTTVKQAGIDAAKLLTANVKGDVNLVGAHIVSATGDGTIKVAGNVTSTELQDKHDKDGNSWGVSGGLAADGVANVTASYGKDDQIHTETIQRGTIGVKDLTVGGATAPELNRDATAMSTQVKDEHIAGSRMDVSAGGPMSRKSKTKTETPPAGDAVDGGGPVHPAEVPVVHEPIVLEPVVLEPYVSGLKPKPAKPVGGDTVNGGVPARPVEVLTVHEPIVPVEIVTPVHTVEPIKPVEVVKPVQVVEPIKPVEIVTPVHTVQPTAPVEVVTPVHTVEPVKPVDVIKVIKPVDVIKVVEPTPTPPVIVEKTTPAVVPKPEPTPIPAKTPPTRKSVEGALAITQARASGPVKDLRSIEVTGRPVRLDDVVIVTKTKTGTKETIFRKEDGGVTITPNSVKGGLHMKDIVEIRFPITMSDEAASATTPAAVLYKMKSDGTLSGAIRTNTQEKMTSSALTPYQRLSTSANPIQVGPGFEPPTGSRP